MLRLVQATLQPLLPHELARAVEFSTGIADDTDAWGRLEKLLVAPLRAVAQVAGKVYRVGYLSARATHAAMDEAFVRALRELSYTEGRNLVIEYQWAGNDVNRLQTLADELVRLNVDVIVTATTAGTRAALRATRTIPIVMAATADPVGSGLVASLGRPGGNVTGLSLQTTDVARKRLQLMTELVPRATRIA